MALVLVEGEEKIPSLLNTANASITPLNPRAMKSEASAACRSRPARDFCYTVLLACITGIAAFLLG